MSRCQNFVSVPPAERQHLRHIRREKRLRIKPIARLLGIAPRTFLSYERGERRPPSSTLSRWHSLLEEARL